MLSRKSLFLYFEISIYSYLYTSCLWYTHLYHWVYTFLFTFCIIKPKKIFSFFFSYQTTSDWYIYLHFLTQAKRKSLYITVWKMQSCNLVLWWGKRKIGLKHLDKVSDPIWQLLRKSTNLSKHKEKIRTNLKLQH